MLDLGFTAIKEWIILSCTFLRWWKNLPIKQNILEKRNDLMFRRIPLYGEQY